MFPHVQAKDRDAFVSAISMRIFAKVVENTWRSMPSQMSHPADGERESLQREEADQDTGYDEDEVKSV